MNKAVALSHLNISVNLVQMANPWDYYKYTQDIVLGVIPFYHIYGGSTVVLLSYFLGVPFVILPKFNPVQCLAAIEKHKITVRYFHDNQFHLAHDLPFAGSYGSTASSDILRNRPTC